MIDTTERFMGCYQGVQERAGGYIWRCSRWEWVRDLTNFCTIAFICMHLQWALGDIL